MRRFFAVAFGCWATVTFAVSLVWTAQEGAEGLFALIFVAFFGRVAWVLWRPERPSTGPGVSLTPVAPQRPWRAR